MSNYIFRLSLANVFSTFIHKIIYISAELPSEVLVTLLIKMSDIEQRLAAGCSEDIQMSSLIASFQIARDLVVSEN